MDGLSFLSIDADESNWLEREFEEKEVWEVSREMNGDKAPGSNGDKAPGSNGLSLAFFQKC